MTLAKEVPPQSNAPWSNEFRIWRLSKIDNKKFGLPGPSHPKETIQLSDADMLLDEIFATDSRPLKRRNLNLSLKQTKILATLLPDAIINISDLSKDITGSFVGVLLFADVSGFTALCEKYNDFGKSGSDKLTVTLNKYLGAMVEVIYQYGGDVLKFSGDAILSLWKLESNEYLHSLIHRVISCALFIQNSMGVYETDVKILLRVKVAISAGNMTFTVIGNDNSRHYIVAGSPVEEVKLAEKVCVPGDVVLANSAWGHLSPVNYEHYREDNEHIKIKRIIYNPESSRREIFGFEKRIPIPTHRSDIHHNFILIKESHSSKISVSSNFSEVRFHIEQATKRNLSSELRTFLLPSVIQQIDADLPMEYLSEMRNITVMFVNIIPTRLRTNQLISLVDMVYITICGLTKKAKGTVNKVSLFDKDVMVLVIFGLRGFSHEGEIGACLKCAHAIRQACYSLDGVMSVSIGVTTGPAYFGVVGHPLRREFTVIGAAVNKAARIMCAYPGKVTCDRDTYLFSNIDATFFVVQERKPLKGIEDTGPIYEFTYKNSENKLATIRENTYPLLGREEEIQTFQNVLETVLFADSQYRAVLIRGQARIGKTRLMNEMILKAHENGFSTITVALHHGHSTLTYGAAQYIVKQVLDIPDTASMTYKEQIIMNMLRMRVPISELWYLNEVINVNFPTVFDEHKSSHSKRKFEKISSLFNIILTEGTGSKIIAVDNVDCCDELSWKLIKNVILQRVKFVIMTMVKRHTPGFANLEFPSNIEPSIVKINLTGLPDAFIPTLACQILHARAVPVEVVRILSARSNGSPGWCHSFLLSLCQSKILRVEELPEWHIKNLGLIMPPEADLIKREFLEMLNETRTNEEHEEVVQSTENLSFGIAEEADTEEKKIISTKKINSTQKIKYRKYRAENDFRSAINHKGSLRDALQIEDAYANLQERIQLARSQFLAWGSHSHKTSSWEKSEIKNEEEIIANAHAKADEITLETESPLGVNERDTKLFTPVDNVQENEGANSGSKTSLKDKIQETNNQFTRMPVLSEGIERRQPGRPLVQIAKSLQVLKQEKQFVLKSKSAMQLSNPRSQSTNENYGATQENIFSEDGILELSQHVSKKTHTDYLIEESIKIFVEKKKFQKRNIEKPSYSSTSLGSTFATGSQTVEGRASQSRPNQGRVISKVMSREYVITENKQEEYRSNESVNDTHKRVSSQNIEVRQPQGSTAGTSEYKPSIVSYKRVGSSKSGARRVTWTAHTLDKQRKETGADSSGILSKLEFIKQSEETSAVLPAILVNGKINLEVVSTPICFLGIIMSAFDCLPPYEQVVLKCGSVIGEKFTRKMLNAIMHNPNPLLTAEAVKRLFEMQILSCGSNIAENEYKPSDEPRCVCPLLNSDIIDDSFPRYSFCHLLSFKYPMFCSTLYELIPIDQKREFHLRAVEFLEKEKKYCASCELLLKKDHKFNQKIRDIGKPKLSPERHSREEIITSAKHRENDVRKDKIFSKQKAANPIFFPNLFPNFRNCECLVLEANALKQLINHSLAAGMKEKEIHFIIDYSSVIITLGKFEEAERVLKSAEAMMKDESGQSIQSKKQRKELLGRISLLLGQLHFELGQLKKAHNYLISALRYFGSPFGHYNYLELLFDCCIKIASESQPSNDNTRSKIVLDNKAVCLSLLSNVYMLEKKWMKAKSMATSGLNILKGNNNNDIELCNAYSNVIDVCRHTGSFRVCRRLEVAATESCIKSCTYRTQLQLLAIGRLNFSILNARLMSGYLLAASELGEIALKISQSISSQNVEIYTICVVSKMMMYMGKINRAAGLLLPLSKHNIWYYILSLDFILETGFSIENSNTCLEVIENAINEENNLDTDLRRLAVSTVYVWMSRLRNFRDAELWSKKLSNIQQTPLDGGTLNHFISVLRILEGHLLNLAHDRRKDLRNNPLNAEVKSLINATRKLTRSVEFMRPRFLHLYAYYKYQKNKISKAMSSLAKAKYLSTEHGNLLEWTWISHNKMVWLKKHDFDKDYWTKYAHKGEIMKWTEDHNLLTWINYMYSLECLEN